ncbi:MAG: hypothetical protein APR63_03805 [Desulfuromonas sp. SDB]|nr:MAG: hypothetical protein APR63_03805 [Desulfuromonas sp. SDB]
MKIKLAKLIDEIQPSATIKLSAKAKQMKASGIDVINLTAGEPDFDTPDNIKQAARKALEQGFTRYLPAAGLPELRKAVAEAESKKLNASSYQLENVAIASGCKHAIYNSLLSICNPGDEVIIPVPYWVSYPYLVKLAGAKPVYLETKDRGFLVDPQRLSSMITSKTKALFLNSPSNPVGNVYPRDHLIKIWEVVKSHPDLFIISDEIYDHIVFDDLQHISIASVDPQAKQRTIIVNGVSKTYAMTGWRIGWNVAESDIINNSVKIQSHTTSCACSISQWAALEAVTGNQDCINQMSSAYQKRKNLLLNKLKSIDHLEAAPIQGAFFAWLDISWFLEKCTNSKIKSGLDLTDYLLEQKHLAVVPGNAFGDDYAIRISYAVSESDLSEGIKRLEQGLMEIT